MNAANTNCNSFNGWIEPSGGIRPQGTGRHSMGRCSRESSSSTWRSTDSVSLAAARNMSGADVGLGESVDVLNSEGR